LDVSIRTWLVCLAFAAVLGQTPDARAQEDLSIRRCDKEHPGQSITTVLWWAYGIPEYLIVGPDWIRTECLAFTMVPGKVYPAQQFQPALQRELADRMYLAAHKEFREIEVLVLKLPGDGTPLRLQPKEAGRNAHSEINYRSLKMPGFEVSALAQQLSEALRRPVIDETGLGGSFDINLTWSGTDLFQRVKEQLGLELASAKRPIQELVVDRIEKLSSPE